MKKINIFVLSCLVLSMFSCRQDGDYFRNPNDNENAASVTQERISVATFENIWSTINTGYAFWDITDVDWDQRYLEFKPKFEEIDSKMSTYKTADEYIKDLQPLYDSLVSGLKDGHMVVMAGLSSQYRTFSRPSEQTNKSRMHADKNAVEFRNSFLSDLSKNENVSGFDSCYFVNIATGERAGHTTCVYTLTDGRKVPYLWNSDFVTASTVEDIINKCQDPEQVEYAKKWQPIYDMFLDNLINTPKSELGGVILDLRANGGGELNSIQNYINIFAGEEHTYWETRYKEGMGRYDMSAWVPFAMNMPERYRDLAADGIPIVVLCDVNSVSSAEITTGSIMQMPTAYIIGERTWGGQGPLNGDNNTQFNVTYGGVSGNRDMTLGFFVYTSNFENRPVGGPILEGIGVSPDEEVLYKEVGYQGQFDAAIAYLESKK